MDNLTSLPPELLLQICSHLNPASRHFLSLAARRFHCFLGPTKLPRLDTRIARVLGSRYHEYCQRCSRYRQFFHFIDVIAPISPERCCIDCFYNLPLPKYRYFGNWLGGHVQMCQACRVFVRWDITTMRHNCGREQIRDVESLGSVDWIRRVLEEIERRAPTGYLLTYKPGIHSCLVANLKSDRDRFDGMVEALRDEITAPHGWWPRRYQRYGYDLQYVCPKKECRIRWIFCLDGCSKPEPVTGDHLMFFVVNPTRRGRTIR